MRKSPASEWISVPEAARLKGVTESSVRVAIQTGRLMGGKVGRSYIVRRGDIEAWRPGLRGPKRGRLGEGRAALREAVGAFLAAGGSDEAIRQRCGWAWSASRRMGTSRGGETRTRGRTQTCLVLSAKDDHHGRGPPTTHRLFFRGTGRGYAADVGESLLDAPDRAGRLKRMNFRSM